MTRCDTCERGVLSSRAKSCKRCRENARNAKYRVTKWLAARDKREYESEAHVEALFAMQKARGRKWTGVSA